MSRTGYEPIPDVEEGLLVSKESKKLSPQERYPDANDQEAELLGLLDRCIGEADVTVNIPNVSLEDMASSRSSFCYALLLPTLSVLVVTGAAWLIASYTAPSMVVSAFPFLVAVIVFCSSIGPIHQRILSQASKAVGAVEQTSGLVNSSLDDITVFVGSRVKSVGSMVDKVMEPINKKIEKAKEEETALTQLDPTIEMPVPVTAVELDGAADEVEKSVHFVKETVSVTPTDVPTSLRSVQDFHRWVEIPLLLVFLILQLGNAYSVAIFVPEIVEDVWPYIFVAFGAYFMAVLQIGLVFYLTRPAAMVSTVNAIRSSISISTDCILIEAGTYDLCKDILGTRMECIKQQTLDLISSTKTIEGLLGKIATSAAVAKTPKSLETPKKKKKGFLWFSPGDD